VQADLCETAGERGEGTWRHEEQPQTTYLIMHGRPLRTMTKVSRCTRRASSQLREGERTGQVQRACGTAGTQWRDGNTRPTCLWSFRPAGGMFIGRGGGSRTSNHERRGLRVAIVHPDSHVASPRVVRTSYAMGNSSPTREQTTTSRSLEVSKTNRR